MRAALRRVIQLVVVLLCVSFFSFALLSLAPGDPVTAIVGFATPAQKAVIRHQLHFDRPFLTQYWEWLSGVLHGNLGNQYFGPTGAGQGVDRARSVAAGLAAADAVHDDPHDPDRDPARRARGVPGGEPHRQGHQHGCVRVDRAARLRARADPLVLGRA